MVRVQFDITAKLISDSYPRYVTIALDGDARYNTRRNILVACVAGGFESKRIGEYHIDIPPGKHKFSVSVSGSPHSGKMGNYAGIWRAKVTLLINKKPIEEINFQGTRSDQETIELEI